MIEFSKREKRMLMVLAGVAACTVVYLIVSQVMSYKKEAGAKSESNASRISKMEELSDEYRMIKQKRASYEAMLRNEKGTTTIIEENAGSVNILRNKVYTQDRPSNIQGQYKKISTDVKFEGVDIKSLLSFMHKMENSNKLISVSYIKITQGLKGRNLYDVSIKFESLTAQ